MTSNRALQTVKHLYQARKAGHTGSLDPLASGLLPLCFGQATKVSNWLLDAHKTYEVVACIGKQTDTADADGQVIATSPHDSISEAELTAALTVHMGEIEQIPPMYSALKQGGQRLYKLAREGKVVERAPRRIEIHALEVIQFDPQRPRLRVHCSKGTYVRTLVETIAAAMGTLGHVAALRRIELGPFRSEQMITLDQVEGLAGDQARLDELLLTPDVALGGMPEVRLSADEAFYLRNGHPVGHAGRELSGSLRLYDQNGAFLGVGEVLADGRIAPKRLFSGA